MNKPEEPERGFTAKNSFDYVSYGGELRLSNLGQMELLRGAQERGVKLRTMVRGFSMHPFIRDQDVLTIATIHTREPRVGDAVAFIHPGNGKLVIHRIVMKKDAGWVVRGDHCPKADGSVVKENILGRVIRAERKGREVCLGITTAFENHFLAWLSAHNLLLPILKLVSWPLRLSRFSGNRIRNVFGHKDENRRQLKNDCVGGKAEEKRTA
ncbi:MAG: S24 family peptidase [Candidatus Aminicenantes bacterium]